MPSICNRITVQADIDTVFDRTNDIEHWTELFTEYREAVVLERREGYIRFRLTTFPDEAGKVRSWVSERFLDKPNNRITARRLEPLMPFRHMNLEWTYGKTEDGGTEMVWVQEFEVDPASGLTDEQVTRHLNGNTVEQMAAVKANIEKSLIRG